MIVTTSINVEMVDVLALTFYVTVEMTVGISLMKETVVGWYFCLCICI